MIPMAGNPIQITLCHQRGLRAHIAPLIILQILDPALERLHHLRALRHQKRQPLPDHIHRRKQFHLASKLVVVALLDILEVRQILLKLRILRVSRTVDAGEHLILLAAAPVCAGGRNQLDRLDIFRAHQMRSRAQINKIPLFIEGNLRILRQIINQLHLVRFLLLLHHLNCLRARHGKAGEFRTLLDNFLHLRLKLIKCLAVKWRAVKIIVKPIVNRRSNRKFCLRVKALYCLRQYMGSRVAVCPLSHIVLESQNTQFTVL